MAAKKSGLLEMKAKMREALGEALPGTPAASHEELRDACKKLTPDTPRVTFGTCDVGDVAVPLAYYKDCREFGQGSTNTPPSAPRWPPQHQPLRWEDDDKTDVAFLPPAAARQLLHLTGGRGDLKLREVNAGCSLVTPDGQARYVFAGVCEGRGWGNLLGYWFLPSSAGLGDAVTAATGRRPRRITGEDGKVKYDLGMTCLQWSKDNDIDLHVTF